MNETILTKDTSSPVRSSLRCIVCGNAGFRALFCYTYHQKQSHIVECQTCGHLCMDPVPLVELNERNMETIGDGEMFGSALLRRLYRSIVIGREVSEVKDLLKKEKPRLLDIGCGTGWTTSIWRDEGFDTVGLEPSQARSQYCRDTYGLEVFTGHVEAFESDEKFDVITLRHLLEHIADPAQVLRKIRTLLKEDGVLLITVPNIRCMGRMIFQENWEWILPWHLHFYHPQTLPRLLRNANFEPVRMYQMPSPLWYSHALINTLGPRSRAAGWVRKIPRPVSMTLFSPLILLGLVLGMNDNLTVISRKSSS